MERAPTSPTPSLPSTTSGRGPTPPPPSPASSNDQPLDLTLGRQQQRHELPSPPLHVVLTSTAGPRPVTLQTRETTTPPPGPSGLQQLLSQQGEWMKNHPALGAIPLYDQNRRTRLRGQEVMKYHLNLQEKIHLEANYIGWHHLGSGSPLHQHRGFHPGMRLEQQPCPMMFYSRTTEDYFKANYHTGNYDVIVNQPHLLNFDFHLDAGDHLQFSTIPADPTSTFRRFNLCNTQAMHGSPRDHKSHRGTKGLFDILHHPHIPTSELLRAADYNVWTIQPDKLVRQILITFKCTSEHVRPRSNGNIYLIAHGQLKGKDIAMCLPIRIISSWEVNEQNTNQTLKAYFRAEHRRLSYLPFLQPAPSNAELFRRRMQHDQTAAAARNTGRPISAAPVNQHQATAMAAVQAQQQRMQTLAGWQHWTQQINLARAHAALQLPTPLLVIQDNEENRRRQEESVAKRPKNDITN